MTQSYLDRLREKNNHRGAAAELSKPHKMVPPRLVGLDSSRDGPQTPGFSDEPEWFSGASECPERGLVGLGSSPDGQRSALVGDHAHATHALRDATEAALADDRRTCRQCLNLARNGRCLAAGRGEIPMTSRQYAPDPDQWQRCIGYAPGADDSNQRPGDKRYSLKIFRAVVEAALAAAPPCNAR